MSEFNDLDLSSDVDSNHAESGPPPAEGDSPTAYDLRPEGAPAGRSSDESVFGIIANVEEQLSRIRSAQAAQDEQLQSLEQRSAALREAEKTLEQRAADLAKRQESIQAARSEVEAQRSAVDEERRALDERQSSLDERQQQLDAQRAEVDESRQQVDSERDSIAEQKAKLEQGQQLLDEHWAEMRSERERLSAQAEDLERREAEIGRELEGVRRELDDAQRRAGEAEAARSGIEAEKADFAERMQRAEANVGELIQQLESAQNEVEQKSNELSARSAEAESERSRAEELQSRVAELQTEVEQAKERIAAAEAEGLEVAEGAERERDEARAKAESLEAELASAREACEEARREVESRDEKIARQQEALHVAKSKLSELSQAIGEQTEQIQRGAAAMAEVREQKDQIERLKEQLAQAKRAGDPDELARKEERIAELTEALRQARGQSMAREDVREREARLQALSEENDALRNELERARVEVGETNKALEAVRAAQGGGVDEQVLTLQSKVRELEAELAEARAAADSSDSNDEAAGEQLRQRAHDLKRVADHLRRRRERLQRARRLFRDRAAARTTAEHQHASARNADAAHENHVQRVQLQAQLQQERESLQEAARALARSEQAMIRKWARPRAVVTMVWFVVLLGLLGIGSWFAADRFFPAVRAATVTIEAEARPGFPITEEQARQWQVWHEERLADDSFLRAAAKRFEDRRLEAFAEPVLLKKYLDEHLALDSTKDGELIMTLSGTDGPLVRTVLDTLALTLVSESRRQAGDRPDGARTALVGEHVVNGQKRYAKINDVPVADERFTYAQFIFGGSAIAAIFLIGFVYIRLSNAKRVFEEDGIVAEPVPSG